MSEDVRFQPLEDLAYKRLFEHRDTREQVVVVLAETGENETICEMSIEAAFTRRHEEALAGKLDHYSWCAAMMQNLDRSGKPVLALGGLSVLVAAAALYAMSLNVPQGERLRITYIFMSVGVGLATFYFGSMPVYQWLHRQSLDNQQDKDNS